MSLSDLASIGSFISGLAVLVSLIFLYFQLKQMNDQVRQAEKNQQALIRQGRTERAIDILIGGLEPSVADAMSKVHAQAEDLTQTQVSQ